MNINQLISFVQAAELGSLSKAATSLYTVQSAISRQVKALEDELETQLFIRHGRGLKLTETGQKLFSRATHILKEIEEVKSEIISNNAKLSGRVTVGMPPSVASVLIGTLAKRLRKEYPHIKLRFADTFSET
ncbi:MAG: LysR family transcriptional regulator, partial [Methylococcales bacterium]